VDHLCGLLCLAAALPVAPATTASEDEKVLREARVSADGPSLLDYLRRHTLTAAQRDQVRGLLPRLGDDDFKVRQQASAGLLALGPAVAPHLRRALDDPDEEVRERLRAALAVLEPASRPAVSAAVARLVRARALAGAVPVLLTYLPEADNEAVEDEVASTLAVLGVSEGKVAAVVADALKDADPVRRAAAALVLGRSGTREQRAAAQALLADPSPLVRWRAAQGLVAAHDRAALPALAALVGEAPLAVAVRADELLALVAGPRAPRVFGTDAAGRRRMRAAWETWARLHGPADLGRAAVDLPPFNPALRAAAAGRRLVVALHHDDREVSKDATDVPFLLGEQVLATRGDLENSLIPFAQGLRNQAPAALVLWTRFAEAGPRAVPPAASAFLARFRKGEVRPVEVLWQAPERGVELQDLALVVRLAGDRVRIVALDSRR
jgi:HEAT repeat protein